MLIDFDHGVVETERPIRVQGIYKRDARVGHNCWIRLRRLHPARRNGRRQRDLGISTVVTKDLPDNAVVAGATARVLRMRPEPESLHWR